VALVDDPDRQGLGRRRGCHPRFASAEHNASGPYLLQRPDHRVQL